MDEHAGPLRPQALAAFAFLAATTVAAATGTLFMPGAWYAGLDKPAWTPPSSLFAPVWTALYLGIAIAGFLAWRAASGRKRRIVVGAWAVQMILNAAWSAIFFGLQQPLLALAEILLLFFSIVACIAVFAAVSRPAAILLVPYALWVAFASALNAAIWQLNR